MKIIKKIAVIGMLCASIAGTAQNTDQVKKTGPADSYARSSISYLLLDFSNEKYAPLLRNAINTTKMPSKFDNNEIEKKVLAAPYYHTGEFPNIKENTTNIPSR